MLEAWGEGETEALDRLVPLVYDELKRMAKRYMSSQAGGGQTLQATALIHEAYLKLANHKALKFANHKAKKWHNLAHFFAVAAQAMRHILVDHARTRQAGKRGGATQIVALDDVALVSNERADYYAP